jgi:NAD(P)-dependent dehydrogenase (short-subunit alcohol dehydrogenase family)
MVTVKSQATRLLIRDYFGGERGQIFLGFPLRESSISDRGQRDIGRTTALGLAEAGVDVLVTSRKLPTLEKVADEIEIKKMGRKALPVAAHMGGLEEIRKLVETVAAEFSKIDILVNNAGTALSAASALETDDRLWDAIMN